MDQTRSGRDGITGQTGMQQLCGECGTFAAQSNGEACSTDERPGVAGGRTGGQLAIAAGIGLVPTESLLNVVGTFAAPLQQLPLESKMDSYTVLKLVYSAQERGP